MIIISIDEILFLELIDRYTLLIKIEDIIKNPFWVINKIKPIIFNSLLQDTYKNISLILTLFYFNSIFLNKKNISIF